MSYNINLQTRNSFYFELQYCIIHIIMYIILNCLYNTFSFLQLVLIQKNLSTVYKYWKWILISFHVPSPILQTCDSQDRGGSTEVFYGFGVMFSIGEESI